MDANSKPAYIVYVSDTRPEGRASEVRYYRTQAAARKRFDELNRTLVRTGHNYVMLGRRCSQTGDLPQRLLRLRVQSSSSK